MEMEFKELMYTRPANEVAILRNAAANFGKDEEESLMMCRMYFPAMSLEKIRLFMQWLAKQPAAQSGGRGKMKSKSY